MANRTPLLQTLPFDLGEKMESAMLLFSRQCVDLLLCFSLVKCLTLVCTSSTSCNPRPYPTPALYRLQQPYPQPYPKGSYGSYKVVMEVGGGYKVVGGERMKCHVSQWERLGSYLCPYLFYYTCAHIISSI